MSPVDGLDLVKKNILCCKSIMEICFPLVL